MIYILQSIWKLSPFANGVTGLSQFAEIIGFQRTWTKKVRD